MRSNNVICLISELCRTIEIWAALFGKLRVYRLNKSATTKNLQDETVTKMKKKQCTDPQNRLWLHDGPNLWFNPPPGCQRDRGNTDQSGTPVPVLWPLTSQWDRHVTFYTTVKSNHVLWNVPGDRRLATKERGEGVIWGGPLTKMKQWDEEGSGWYFVSTALLYPTNPHKTSLLKHQPTASLY